MDKTAKFIQSAKLIHGDKYDYSLVHYSNCHTKVTIICQEHGKFEQSPTHHIHKTSPTGCPRCARPVYDLESFVKAAKKLHGDVYDYSQFHYQNDKTHSVIICPTHGSFSKRPNDHIHGKQGCPTCALRQKADNQVMKVEEFIQRSKIIHSDRYDYSKVQYTHTLSKVTIVCPEHGEFAQTPNRHLQGQGCSLCSGSHGERRVASWLEKHKIRYTTQATIREFNPKKRFDFFLPDLQVYIEFDGEQHFRPCFGRKLFELQTQRDLAANIWCADNNINLIRIAYYEDVHEKLKQLL